MSNTDWEAIEKKREEIAKASIPELEALAIEDRIIHILYIHGYSGEGNSPTAQALATALLTTIMSLSLISL